MMDSPLFHQNKSIILTSLLKRFGADIEKSSKDKKSGRTEITTH